MSKILSSCSKGIHKEEKVFILFFSTVPNKAYKMNMLLNVLHILEIAKDF